MRVVEQVCLVHVIVELLTGVFDRMDHLHDFNLQDVGNVDLIQVFLGENHKKRVEEQLRQIVKLGPLGQVAVVLLLLRRARRQFPLLVLLAVCRLVLLVGVRLRLREAVVERVVVVGLAAVVSVGALVGPILRAVLALRQLRATYLVRVRHALALLLLLDQGLVVFGGEGLEPRVFALRP